MMEYLRHLLNSCWEEEEVPGEWRQGVIVKLPKKGNLSNCDNWRGITLLSVPGKVFSAILLNRLKAAIDGKLREEQAGFRSNRSCTEQIFVLRTVIEQCLEFQKSLIINFIDFQKAFDSIHRETLWKIASLYGIPPKFIAMFKNLYQNSKCCIKTKYGNTEFFDIVSGVRQGCLLSPLLFSLAIDYVMRQTVNKHNCGIPWTTTQNLTDLDFADDISLLSETTTMMQTATSNLENEAIKVGLRINENKTKTMNIRGPDPKICVNGKTIENVHKFTYLGSILAIDGDVEVDINSRIGKASAVFNRMTKLWKSNTISTAVKVRLYKSVVLSTCLYASETWKSTSRTARKLNVFHQRCLRKIFKISYRQHITNEEILRRSGSCMRLSDIVEERRMRLAGHILRLADNRMPKIAMKWTPLKGKRARGRPKKTWRRTFQEDLQKRGLKLEDAPLLAQDRTKWRTLAARCTELYWRN